MLRALQLNEPEDLIGWARSATKTDIGALAVEVFLAWAKKDSIAADILAAAANSLASDATSCARRLVKRIRRFSSSWREVFWLNSRPLPEKWGGN